MANVLNRTSKTYLTSVHTPNYPTEDWVVNPDLTNVTISIEPLVLWPTKYWVITGDDITLMDQAARDAVDTASVSESRDAVANQLNEAENIIRAFALVVLEEINALRTQHSLPERTVAQLKAALRNKLGS